MSMNEQIRHCVRTWAEGLSDYEVRVAYRAWVRHALGLSLRDHDAEWVPGAHVDALARELRVRHLTRLG